MTTPDGGFTVEQLAQLQAMIETVADARITQVYSGGANAMEVSPEDLHYRGQGIYYSPSEGWFHKGPRGTLLKLPGPPSG